MVGLALHVSAQQPQPASPPAAPPAAPAPEIPPARPERPTFSAHSELVVLHVTVIDHKDAWVGSLPREAFAVYEDGARQTITHFSNEDLPIAVGLVIDNSMSMLTRRDMVVNAGLAFIDASRPDDQMFTIDFNEHVWPGLPPAFAFTSSRALLHMALRTVKAEGRTAFNDAVIAALEHMESSPLDRKMLIVLSDGGDNASRARFEDVLARAERSDVVIYSVGLIDALDRDANPRALKRLAKATGGDASFPDSQADVVKAFAEIAHEVRRGYTIGYVPVNTARDGGYRRLRVEVRAPGHDHLTIRVREGYRAARDTASP